MLKKIKIIPDFNKSKKEGYNLNSEYPPLRLK